MMMNEHEWTCHDTLHSHRERTSSACLVDDVDNIWTRWPISVYIATLEYLQSPEGKDLTRDFK